MTSPTNILPILDRGIARSLAARRAPDKVASIACIRAFLDMAPDQDDVTDTGRLTLAAAYAIDAAALLCRATLVRKGCENPGRDTYNHVQSALLDDLVTLRPAAERWSIGADCRDRIDRIARGFDNWSEWVILAAALMRLARQDGHSLISGELRALAMALDTIEPAKVREVTA